MIWPVDQQLNGVIDVAASTPGLPALRIILQPVGCQLAGKHGQHQHQLTISYTGYRIQLFNTGLFQCRYSGTCFDVWIHARRNIQFYSRPCRSTAQQVDRCGCQHARVLFCCIQCCSQCCQLAGSNNAFNHDQFNSNTVNSFSYTTPVCSNAANQSPILTTGFTSGGTFSSHSRPVNQ